MKLQSLKLINFKGVTTLHVKPNGRNMHISGDNGTGKTSIADAYSFVLYHKDTLDRSPLNFGIKRREITGDGTLGEVIPDAECEVEAVFDTITLRKTYGENRVRPRGQSETISKGHNSHYYVDDLEVQAGEFSDAVEKILPEKLFKILTQPLYFAGDLHWTERRKILADLAGEILVSDIIARDPALESYPDIVGDKDPDKIMEHWQKRVGKLREQLKDIPVRIDEASRQLEDVSGVPQAKKKVAELEADRDAKQQRLSEWAVGGGVSELRVQRQEVEAKLLEVKNKHNKAKEQQLSDLRGRVSELDTRLSGLLSDLIPTKELYDQKKKDLEKVAAEIKQLEADRERQQAAKPKEQSIDRECYACGQGLPEEKIKTAKVQYKNYVEGFNAKKAAKLKTIDEGIAARQDKIKDITMEGQEAREKGLKLNGQVSQVQTKLGQLRKELEEKAEAFPAVETLPRWQSLQAETEEIDKKIVELQLSNTEQHQELQGELDEVKAKIKIQQAIIDRHDKNQKIRERIEELQAERTKADLELEKAEENIRVIKLFRKEQSQIITQRVNDKFQHVKWRMFKYQVNGEIDPDVCDAVYDSIPWSESLNTGSKIKAGLDIINTLSKHYGVAPPVIIDNRESVSEIPEIDSQVISLFKVEGLDELKMEPV